MSRVIYTAIYGQYDDLKTPLVFTPGWRYVVFTDQPLRSDVWEIVRTEEKAEDPQLMARMVKITGHMELPETESIWVDGSFIINCNLDRWWSRRVNGPLTVIRHPERNCVYEEALECIRQKRGNAEKIMRQHLAYRDQGMPAAAGLVSTGVLMRIRTPSTDAFCQDWFQELSQHSLRDQLSFAHTAWKRPGVHTEIQWDYRTGREFLHVPHLKNPNRIHRLKALGIQL